MMWSFFQGVSNAFNAFLAILRLKKKKTLPGSGFLYRWFFLEHPDGWFFVNVLRCGRALPGSLEQWLL